MLCDFRKNISGARTHFQIEGIKTPDLPVGEINRLSGEKLKPRKKLAFTEWKEVAIEIRKSNVDMLAGLIGDIDIDWEISCLMTSPALIGL